MSNSLGIQALLINIHFHTMKLKKSSISDRSGPKGIMGKYKNVKVIFLNIHAKYSLVSYSHALWAEFNSY